LNIKRVTVYDIAKRPGISHTTVALALRNHADVTVRDFDGEPLARKLYQAETWRGSRYVPSGDLN